VTKASGTTNLNQTRTANKVNEITNITESTGPTWIVPAYDAAGNTITMPQPAIPTSSFNAVYDAWNRMVSISAASTPVGKYQYDGRNFRIVKQTYSGGTLSQTRDFYFTANWQDIEEDVAGSLADQYVWGIRYIDELICRDDPTYGRLYATQDANFNVTSITDTGGSVQERYLFDPYGNRTIMNSSWVTITTSTYYWALGPWCLMIHLESGLVYGRLRYLQPLIGWTARDRLGYGDGPNLYEYCRSAPIRYVDPFGTVTCDEARKCQAGCIRFYARSKNCKDVRYGPGVSGTMQGDDARNQALTDCLNSCRNQGYPFNNVSLADCAPAPACPAPSKPEPPESDAKKVAPHLAATVAEQGARFTAEKAGAEGGSDIIGPAATIAGGLEVAPDAIRILINVAGRNYMTNHAGEVKDNEWGCDPGYLGTLTLSTSFDNLAWLATAVEQNAVPLPS
jgi:RHS repeat-associated protein